MAHGDSRSDSTLVLPEDRIDPVLVTPSKSGSSTGISRRTPTQSPSQRDPPHSSTVPISPLLSPHKRRRRRSSSMTLLKSSQFSKTCGKNPVLLCVIAWILVLIIGVGILRWTTLDHPSQTPSLPSIRRRVNIPTSNAHHVFAANTTAAVHNETSWSGGDVVHVIHTRLMQTQPDLVELGLARLQIFKSICLPTMQGQTSQNFLWVIRTDPLLNETLKQELLGALRPLTNVVVLACNENPDHFPSSETLSTISPDHVWTNNYDQLLEHHVAAQSRMVLESRLDADDGLHLEFVRYMQQQAERYLRSDPTRWVVWCAYSHLEWHYSSPFHENDPEIPEGYLVGIKAEECVTPGITMTYNTHVQGLPHSSNHQHLHKTIPPCMDINATNCLRRLEHLMPTAIRARTPTSAGMSNVLFGPYGHRSSYKRTRPQLELQSTVWNGVHNIFGLDRPDAARMREYLGSKVMEIAADNWKGQCTRGHSCKKSAKEMLQKLMEHPWITQHVANF